VQRWLVEVWRDAQGEAIAKLELEWRGRPQARDDRAEQHAAQDSRPDAGSTVN